MKYFARFLRFATVAVGTAAFIAAVQAEIGSAVVRAVKGSASYMEDSGTKPVRVGVVLKAGATIMTQAESQVDLFLDHNGPVVRVTENTTLKLAQLDFIATGTDIVIDTQLDLQQGRILGYVKKTSDSSRYSVKTPQGVAAIKGTEYDISATGVIKVVQGQLVFSYVNSSGQTVTQAVRTGEVFMPTDTRPRPIDPAELDNLLKEFTEIKVKVTAEGLIVIVPPQEPFVSAIVGSSGSGESHQGHPSTDSPGN